MQTIPDNLDLLLPCGEALRAFIEQPFTSAADLKHALRARGIFLNRNEKRDTIPILMCCLLSPREFDELRESQATREDNPKTMTRTLGWNSSKTLLDAIPNNLKMSDLIMGEYAHYKILGTPAFVPVGNNPNDISYEFEIERTDLTKNWAAAKSNFKGKLRIQTSPTGGSIKFVLTHTAEETKDLNRKLVQHLTQHFKQGGDVRDGCEIETILFMSFDNESRIAFFRSLTKGLESIGFEFCEMTDLGVCPDANVTLPREIRWMEDKVNDLKLSGKSLEDTAFIKNRDYHKFLLFYGMEARFKFECPLAAGSCAIVFEFPDFASKKDPHTEFELNISTLNLSAGCSSANRTEVKEDLLRRINDFKLAQFEKHRLRAAPPAAAVAPSAVSGPVQLELDAARA